MLREGLGRHEEAEIQEKLRERSKGDGQKELPDHQGCIQSPGRSWQCWSSLLSAIEPVHDVPLRTRIDRQPQLQAS